MIALVRVDPPGEGSENKCRCGRFGDGSLGYQGQSPEDKSQIRKEEERGKDRTPGTSKGRQLPRDLESFARGQATDVADLPQVNRFHRYQVHEKRKPHGGIAGRNGCYQNEIQVILVHQPDHHVVQEREGGKDVRSLRPLLHEESVPRRGVPGPAVAGPSVHHVKLAAGEEVEFRAKTRPDDLIKNRTNETEFMMGNCVPRKDPSQVAQSVASPVSHSEVRGSNLPRV